MSTSTIPRDAGRDPAGWDSALAAVPRLAPADLAERLGVGQGAGLLVLAAHPDDETLGLGRLIAAWAATLGRTATVLFTDGEACYDAAMARPPGIASRRLCEWQRAADALGIASHRRLGLPDSRLADRRPALLTAVEAAVGDALAPASGLVLAAPCLADPHPDHAAVGWAARQVAGQRRLALLEYPIWLTYWNGPEALAELLPRPVAVECDAAAEAAYARAAACYSSQLLPPAPGVPPVVPSGLLERLCVQLVLPTPISDGHEDGTGS